MVSPSPVRFNPKNLVAKKAPRGVGYVGANAPPNKQDNKGKPAKNPKKKDGEAAGEPAKVEKGKEVFGATFPLNRFKRLIPLLAEMPPEVGKQGEKQGDTDANVGDADSSSSVEEKALTDKESAIAGSYDNVQFDVRFVLKHWGRNIMAVGEFDTAFGLECQRCLGNYRHPVQARFELVLVPDQEAAEKLPESEDPVVLDEDGMIHLVDLFEDEIILQIPSVPKHDNVDDCRFDSPVALIDESGDELGEAHPQFGEQSVERRKDNPFDALKSLKFDQ